MKINLKEKPWYIVPCSIKIKLSSSVTSTACDSNSGYVRASLLHSEFKDCVGFCFMELPHPLEFMLISFKYRSIDERILLYNVQSHKSEGFQWKAEILYCRKTCTRIAFKAYLTYNAQYLRFSFYLPVWSSGL